MSISRVLVMALPLMWLVLAVAGFTPTISPVHANNSAAASAAETRSDPSPWVDRRGQLTPNVEQMAQQIQTSLYHGLNPEAYELQKILTLTEKALSPTTTEHNRVETIRELEKTLNQSFSDLASHLGSGIVNGAAVQDRMYHKTPKPNLDKLLYSVTGGQFTVEEVFDSITPKHRDYVALQHVLRQLLDDKVREIPRTLVSKQETLVLGDVHSAIGLAKKRLMETGHFAREGGVSDSLNSSFKVAIEAFQKQHHITVSGELDEATVDRMNASVDDDITRVVMSLERWRWTQRDLGYLRVIANVPDYRVRMHNGDQKIADMPIVVGKRKHRTPVFSETIKHVVAAPTWTVPTSIAYSELLPIERSNPGYLERNNYELLTWVGRHQVPIPFSIIPPETWDPGPFPYTIRQKPGEDNALGDVKIMMPNPYAIYFHDTPAKKLFARERRAYSHGCVRLGDPMRLASLIMQLDGVAPETTRAFLDQEKTDTYDLRNPINSHIVYLTTFVDDETDTLQFREDVYRYDPALRKALTKANSLVSVLAKDDAKNIILAKVGKFDL